MATLKLTMDTRRPYGNQKYPVVIRLTVNSASTTIKTGVKLTKNEWDNTKGKVLKSHSMYKEINLTLNKRMAEYEEAVKELRQGAFIQDDELKQRI